MKTFQSLAAGSLFAALFVAGCSHDNGSAKATAQSPTPALAPAPASESSLTITLPLPTAAPAPAPGAIPIPSGQASWTDMEGLTYDQRPQFLADLSLLLNKLDAEIGSLNAKRAAMTTDTKDWDIAMMDVTAARAYLAGLPSEVSRASPDTWDQEKERVGTAWRKAQDACDKVQTSTTS